MNASQKQMRLSASLGAGQGADRGAARSCPPPRIVRYVGEPKVTRRQLPHFPQSFQCCSKNPIPSDIRGELICAEAEILECPQDFRQRHGIARRYYRSRGRHDRRGPIPRAQPVVGAVSGELRLRQRRHTRRRGLWDDRNGGARLELKTPTELEIVEVKVLYGLVKSGYLGGKHTSVEHALGSLATDQRALGKRVVENLIREAVLMDKKTSHGRQPSAPRRRWI